MDISVLKYPHPSKLVTDYTNHHPNMRKFFDYPLEEKNLYQKRYDDLKSREYNREALCQYLYGFNKKYGALPAVLEHIEQLSSPETVAVVGGQQAGLLTGASLTIHKCLSIIYLAVEQEKALGVPVVPIFWIAGEDHDFHEINHVYVKNEHQLPRKKAYHSFYDKLPASKLPLNKDKAQAWLEDVLTDFGETEFTQDLKDKLISALEKSTTIVDFFAYLLHQLFGEYGLILLDSGDSELRKLESSFFTKLIETNRDINQAVLRQMVAMHENGYEPTIDQTEVSANLFYDLDGERELLEWRDEQFQSKNALCQFTKDELLQTAMHEPEHLSNNVVTRPLMQEFLLPTLAFIGGPGEISYWATLKEAFHAVSFQMPPVIPRLNITLVDRTTEKWLKEKGLTVEQVILNGLTAEKEAWLKAQDVWNIDTQVTEAIQSIDQIHESLRRMAHQINPKLDELSLKNRDYIKNQILYLQKKMEKGIKKQHNQTIGKFEAIEAVLKPQNQLQERVWNIYYFMNLYGDDLIARLMQQKYVFDHMHYVVYL